MPVILLIALIICSAYLVSQLISKKDEPAQQVISNVNYINSTSFDISSDSTDLKTSAKGTVFVQGKEGIADRVSIVAAIEIDPKDWGGISFYIPNHWAVASVMNSYPGNNPDVNPSNHLVILNNTDPNSDWKTWVEIGRDSSYRPTGGGQGTVVIDLEYAAHDEPMSETFEFMVSVGSKEQDGIKAVGPDYDTFSVSLTP
ncbi:hypothetical protein [Paenibacillus sp. CCS19]|uniref:hypothetical protein n=1 Tax=Paenibacillus sp. CCS19 TaxID=3158387 RepID=UPI00295EF23E|nr:hypothetical protein [Paenibacillus cellulosilyticus]